MGGAAGGGQALGAAVRFQGSVGAGVRPESCRRTLPADDMSALAPSAKAVAGPMGHLRSSLGFIQEANWSRARLKAGTPEARQGEWQPPVDSCDVGTCGEMWRENRG